MRSSFAGLDYWNARIRKDDGWLSRALELLEQPSKNPAYTPQFSWDMGEDILQLTLRRYCRGDAVNELSQYFPGLLSTWELSNKLAEEVCREHNLKTCRDWTFDLTDLNHYNWCFWLAGLALSLDIPDDQWKRLLALIGGEGQDELLDRVIASRQPGRRIGSVLLQPKPYTRLLKAIDAPRDQQAALLRDFVEHWYQELARTGKQELWWYDYGDAKKNPMTVDSYFGRWCIEAVAAVKAFNIDDSLCLGHPNYPGDLIQDGRSPRYPDPEPEPEANQVEPERVPETKADRGGWLSRLFPKSEGH